MKEFRRRIVSLLLIVAAIAATRAWWQSSRGDWRRLNSRSLYTTVSLTARADSASLARVAGEIDAFFADYTRHFRNDGPLDLKISSAKAGEEVALDSTECALIAYATRAWELTEGAIHPGVGNLIREWGLVWGGTPHVPSDSALEAEREELKRLPYEFDSARCAVRVLREGLHVALGAFSKGWAIDRAAEKIERAGIRDYLLEVGGDLRCGGKNPKESAWRLGVKDPRRPDTLATVLELGDELPCAMASSGGYEKFFVDSATGERHHHILDPRTARSARGTLGATAIAKNARDADLLATWLYVAGPEKAAEVLSKIPGSAAYVVPESGEPFFLRPETR